MARASLLFIPAMGRPSRDWDLVRSHLKDWETTVLDDPAPQSPEEAALSLIAKLEGPAHFVGHSRGGTIASWIAVHAPHLVKSLAVVASPPEASEAFRAHFRGKHEYLASIPDDAFPTHALRRYRGGALVVEVGDDPLYSPTHTLFWRAYLPYARFERFDEGGHDFLTREPGASKLAQILREHVEANE